MANDTPRELTTEAFSSPLLVKLCNLAHALTGIRFMIVFPHGGTWGHARPGGTKAYPAFCRLMQSKSEGAKHCNMCHVLMTIAACSGGETERRCHAGVSVLVTPVSESEEEALAVLSSCTFVPGMDEAAWAETEARGRKLGLDLKALRKAYDELPRLTPEKMKIARELMAITADAAREVEQGFLWHQELVALRGHRRVKTKIQALVEQELKEATSAPRRKRRVKPKTGKAGKKIPLLIEVMANLVTRKPGIPYSVEEIAAAARMSPNHFSTLFREHMGQTFTEFLAKKRIDLAKELLQDLTLNIGEVALKAGFCDAGYFARRFRMKTGRSPRQWRESLKLK